MSEIQLRLLLRRTLPVRRLHTTSPISNKNSYLQTKYFFLENNHKDKEDNKYFNELSEPFKKYHENQLTFVNPFAYFNKYRVPRKPALYMDTPPQDFQVIIDKNENSIPQIGSIVELLSPQKPPILGIVVKQALARFDERYNKLLILTTENELIEAPTFDINFHFALAIPTHGVINFRQIVENRHDSNDKARINAVDFLNLFLDDALALKVALNPEFDRIYCQFAEEYMNAISLIDIIDAIKFKETSVIKLGSSFYDQCVLLLAVHWNLVDSPMWIVPNYIQGKKLSNVVSGYSNMFHNKSDYFVTPAPVWISLSKLEDKLENPDFRESAKAFLTELKAIPKSELESYLHVYEGRHMTFLLDILKFAVVYPHESIMRNLAKLGIFEDGVSTRKIYDLLVTLQIYDSKSDVVLLLGLVDLGDNGADSSFNSKTYDRDFFHHLRKDKTSYHNYIMYGLPIDGDESTSRLAISLETQNSRKHMINIHIPDVTTFASPNSLVMENIFDDISSKSTAITKLFGGETKDKLFTDEFAQQRRFSSYLTASANSEWDDGIPVKRTFEDRAETTCMTISFEFHSHDANPFESFRDRISVSFDNIKHTDVKILDKETLEQCLSGQLNNVLFKLLRLEPEVAPKNKIQLNKGDIHNINFIREVMTTFFKIREHAGASNVNPLQDILLTDASNYSIGDKDEEATARIIQNTSNSFPRSEFLIKELQIFCGALVAEYCAQNNIPIVNHNQSVEPTTYYQDRVMITHDNYLIPPYESDNYHHSVMAKDKHWYISLQASLASKNYLSPETIDTKPRENLPLGLKNGFVNVVDVLTRGEAILNQYQLLFFKQELLSRKLGMERGYLNSIHRFLDLKQLGYELLGPLSESQLSTQIRRFKKSEAVANSIGTFSKRYWALVWLENLKLTLYATEEKLLFSCVITHVGEEMDLGKICKCYCLDMGIEVEVLVENQDIHVGKKVLCNSIIDSDPITGVCLLKDENYGTSIFL